MVTEYDMWVHTESALMAKGDDEAHYDTHEAFGEPETTFKHARRERP